MKYRKTDRGFPIFEFEDRYKSQCSVQDSSLAFESCLWLGVDKAFNGEETSTRMHLTQDMVKELLPILERFVKTGSIEP